MVRRWFASGGEGRGRRRRRPQQVARQIPLVRRALAHERGAELLGAAREELLGRAGRGRQAEGARNGYRAAKRRERLSLRSFRAARVYGGVVPKPGFVDGLAPARVPDVVPVLVPETLGAAARVHGHVVVLEHLDRGLRFPFGHEHSVRAAVCFTRRARVPGTGVGPVLNAAARLKRRRRRRRGGPGRGFFRALRRRRRRRRRGGRAVEPGLCRGHPAGETVTDPAVAAAHLHDAGVVLRARRQRHFFRRSLELRERAALRSASALAPPRVFFQTLRLVFFQTRRPVLRDLLLEVRVHAAGRRQHRRHLLRVAIPGVRRAEQQRPGGAEGRRVAAGARQPVVVRRLGAPADRLAGARQPVLREREVARRVDVAREPEHRPGGLPQVARVVDDEAAHREVVRPVPEGLLDLLGGGFRAEERQAEDRGGGHHHKDAHFVH